MSAKHDEEKLTPVSQALAQHDFQGFSDQTLKFIENCKEWTCDREKVSGAATILDHPND